MEEGKDEDKDEVRGGSGGGGKRRWWKHRLRREEEESKGKDKGEDIE